MIDKEFIKFFSVLIIVAIVTFLGFYFFLSTSCDRKSISFEGHDFGMIQGCMVKHKGRWLPLENIRGFD